MSRALLSRGMALSAALHGAAALALWVCLRVGSQAAVVAELDLSLSPMIAAPANKGGGRAAPSRLWTTPAQGRAPLPVPTQAVEPILEAAEAPCAAPCAENGGGGGTGEGSGAYIPASKAARKPRWIDRFIEPSDYPRVAREAGKDGRVVLNLLIDESGHVRDVRLLQGAYEALNEVALRKVREAVFAPAYDALGRAVPCEVTLPIRFELR